LGFIGRVFWAGFLLPTLDFGHKEAIVSKKKFPVKKVLIRDAPATDFAWYSANLQAGNPPDNGYPAIFLYEH
jgi:hypothetical protein